MGSNRRQSNKDRCKDCYINNSLCICNELSPVKIKTPLDIIMHYKEAKLTSNSSNLMRLLSESCKIHHRGGPEENINYREILDQDNFTPLYLFPSDDAILLDQSLLNKLEKPPKLIIPDGTWGQAKKFKRRIPEMTNILTVTLPLGEISQYKLRTANNVKNLSSFEAIARALSIIEGEPLELELNIYFKLFVNRIMHSRYGGNTPKEKK